MFKKFYKSILLFSLVYLHLAITLVIIPFDCGEKIIIVTNETDASSKKVSALNKQILLAGGHDIRGVQQRCARTSVLFAVDWNHYDLVDSLTAIASTLSERYQKPITVLLHVRNSRTSTFTQLLSYPILQNKIVLQACVYEKSEDEIVYVPYDTVIAQPDEQDENLDEYSFVKCNNYFENLKNRRDIYSAFNGHPLVVIPGFVSSSLYAKKRHNADVDSMFQRPLEMIWPLDMQKITSSVTYGEEWAKSIAQVYNQTADITFNPFYKVDTAFWADPRSIFTAGNGFFYEMTRTMVVHWGYDVAKSVRAAPYDFRKGLNELGRYFKKLRRLIEQTYFINGNRRVVILAHSLGNINAVYFLNRQTKTWKDKYVESYICLAAAFGGSMSALKLILEGEVDGFVNNPTLKTVLAFLARTFSSIPYLLPNLNSKSADQVFITIDDDQYTVDDYDRLFDDVGLNNFKQMYSNAKRYIGRLFAPEVKIYCAYSTGVPTEETFAYVDSDPKTMVWNRKTNFTMDGDRVVNVKSARNTCLNFASYQQEPVFEQNFVGLDHSAMLHDETFLAFLRSVVLS